MAIAAETTASPLFSQLAELCWDRTWAQMVALIEEPESTLNPSTVSAGQEGIQAF
jgi:hypothetical protein